MNTGLGTTASGEIVPLTLADKRTHVFVTGKTGQGKSVLLENMMFDDLAAGRGFAFLDPHGTSVQYIASRIPTDRKRDVIYFDPKSPACPTYNPLEGDDIDLIVEQTVGIIHDKHPDMWGPRLQHTLENTIRLQLQRPGGTLVDTRRVLVDKFYREELLGYVKDDVLKSIWEQEFAYKNQKQWNDEISSTLNKVGPFATRKALRNVVGSPSSIKPRKIMDEGKILLCDLSMGRLGRLSSSLLGTFLVSGFANDAERRYAETKNPRDFTLYVDECRNFTTESFETILSEARKWRLSLVLACQYIEQLPDALQDAIFGNVGTVIAFRSGAKTATRLADELDIVKKQITSLPKYKAHAMLPDHDTRWVATFPPREVEAGDAEPIKATTAARFVRKPRKKKEVREEPSKEMSTEMEGW